MGHLLHALHQRQPLPEQHPHAAAAAYYGQMAAQASQFVCGNRVAPEGSALGALYLSRAEALGLRAMTIKVDGADHDVMWGALDEDEVPGVYAIEVGGYWMRVHDALQGWLIEAIESAAYDAAKARDWL